MSTLLNTLFNKSLTATGKGLQAALGGMQSTVGSSKKFSQWHDFSVENFVIHAHIEYLQWLYGSVFRKQIKHYFLLYNFDVNKHVLKDEHKTALEAFVRFVYLDQKLKEAGAYPRDFEHYTHPFATNIKKSIKKQLLNNQPWVTDEQASREAIIRQHILSSFDHGPDTDKWWAGNDVAFADANSVLDLDDNVGNNTSYQPFLIDNLLYWRVGDGEPAQFSKFIGRASETGSDSTNDPLSKKRAEHAADFITETIDGLLNKSDTDIAIAGVGESEPLIISEGDLEIKENRSVQFTYTQAHDYVHLLTPKELKDDYKQAINFINTEIEEKITYLENFLETPGDTFQLPGFRTIEKLEKDMQTIEKPFSFGMSSIRFAVNFEGDFKDLNLSQNSTIPDAPVGAAAYNNQGTNSSPENKTTFHVLPIPQIISRGEYSTDPRKFRNPLNPQKRLEYGIKTYDLINKLFLNEYKSVSLTITPKVDLFMKAYRIYAANEIIAHSFLMREYSTKELTGIIKKNEWSFRHNFENDNAIYNDALSGIFDFDDDIELVVEINSKSFIGADTFNDGVSDIILDELDSGQISIPYWYDEGTKNYHYKMKKIVSKNLIKMAVLAIQSDLRLLLSGFSDSLEGAGNADFPNLIYHWVTMQDGAASY